MPYCPDCRYEYTEGIKECPDCREKLVDVLPPVADPAALDLVCVASYPHQATAEAARFTLQSCGIPSAVINETVSHVYPSLALASGGVRVMVRKEDLDKAREALESE